MPFAAGSRVTAAKLNQITLKELEAAVTGDQVLTTAAVDISGASITFTTAVANTDVEIVAAIDSESTGSADLPYITCLIDGVAETENLKFQQSGRATRSMTWLATIASAGSHTIKLQRQKIGTANTCTVYGTHSKLYVKGLGIS